VFLTELGDLERFRNRRQLAAYLGLAPSAFESGERSDRKGHITRQGPSRVRHMLCQSAWAALRCSPEWRARYERIRGGSPKRTKVAIVAVMRQLGVVMWHTARSSELDELLREADRTLASAQARQKGAAPPALPSPRPSLSEAEATATRKGLAEAPLKNTKRRDRTGRSGTPSDPRFHQQTQQNPRREGASRRIENVLDQTTLHVRRSHTSTWESSQRKSARAIAKDHRKTRSFCAWDQPSQSVICLPSSDHRQREPTK